MPRVSLNQEITMILQDNSLKYILCFISRSFPVESHTFQAKPVHVGIFELSNGKLKFALTW